MDDNEKSLTDMLPSQWAEKLRREPLPWHKAQSIEMHLFLEGYTVHDSHWFRFWVSEHGEGTAIIWWDVSWTKGRVPYPEDWHIPLPLLAIRFHRISEVAWYGIHTMMDDCISWAESRVATSEEIQRVQASFGEQHRPSDETFRKLIDDGIYYTQFFPCLAGDPSTLRIIHGGNVELLCLSYDGDVIDISGVDSKS